MAEFHETGYGRTFFTHQLPELIGAINRLADALGRPKAKPKFMPPEGVVDSFVRQLDTTRDGIRLKGSLDAKQLEQLHSVVQQHANNLAQALASDE